MRGTLLGTAFLALALVSTGVGCGSEGDDPAEDLTKSADSNISGDVPRGADGKPLPVVLDGQYELATPIDLTSIGVLPNEVSGALSSLSNFKEKPSQTIVDLMASANVPAADFLNSIPGPIRPAVLGYIDDAIFDPVFEGVPVANKLATLLDDVGGIATKSSIVTVLDLPTAKDNGDTTAKHSVRGLGFAWDGKFTVIDAPAELRSKLGSTSVSANIAPLAERSKDVELGRLQIEKHAFTIPFGTFAVTAMDKLSTDRFGADLRGALGKLVDCGKVAEAVSKRCINPPGPGEVCVGHKTEVQALCSKGLDLLVDNAKGAIKKLDVTMNVNLGVAQMWDGVEADSALDAKADRLDVGFWKATYEAFGKKKEILTTFSGHRVGVEPSSAVR